MRTRACLLGGERRRNAASGHLLKVMLSTLTAMSMTPSWAMAAEQVQQQEIQELHDAEAQARREEREAAEAQATDESSNAVDSEVSDGDVSEGTESEAEVAPVPQFTETHEVVDREIPKAVVRFDVNAPRLDEDTDGDGVSDLPSVPEGADLEWPYGKMEDKEVVLDGEEWELPANAFVIEGYRFVRWSTTKDGKDVKDNENTPDIDESFAARPVDDKTKFKDFAYEWSHEVETDNGSKQLKIEQYDLSYAKKSERVIGDAGESVDKDVVTLYAQWERAPSADGTPAPDSQAGDVIADAARADGSSQPDAGMEANPEAEPASASDKTDAVVATDVRPEPAITKPETPKQPAENERVDGTQSDNNESPVKTDDTRDAEHPETSESGVDSEPTIEERRAAWAQDVSENHPDVAAPVDEVVRDVLNDPATNAYEIAQNDVERRVLRLHANGPDVDDITIEVPEEGLRVPGEVFSWSRHRFLGWSSAATDGEIPDLTEGESIPETVTDLYAVWRKLGPIKQVDGFDFSNARLIVGSSSTPGFGRILSEHDGVYLLEFADEKDAAWAYVDHKDDPDIGFIAPDIMIAAASDIKQDPADAAVDSNTGKANSIDEFPILRDDLNMADAMAIPNNPFLDGTVMKDDDAVADLSIISSISATAPLPKVAAGVVALIDTGVSSESDNVLDSFSVIGNSVTDDNGHGTAMLGAMLGVEPDTQVVSIKALDASGTGTAASVYAAIEAAIEMKVKVINLSLSAPAIEGNAAVEEAIRNAYDAGIIVVGAAGNDGKDAKWYIPGKMGIEAVIVGACDAEGIKIASSNFGDTVDAYAAASSTSMAAAKVSAWLNANSTFGHELTALDSDSAKKTLKLSTIQIDDDESGFFDMPEDQGDFTAAWTHPTLSFRVYRQTYQYTGWYNRAPGAEAFSDMGENKRVEGFELKFSSVGSTSGGTQYRAYCQTYQWRSWASNGAYTGTIGEAKRMEAYEAKMTGNIANLYTMHYCCAGYLQDTITSANFRSNTSGSPYNVASANTCGVTGQLFRIIGISISFYVRSFSVTHQYRFQNADGSYGAWQNTGSGGSKATGTYIAKWSRAQDATYKYAEIPAFEVTGATTKQVNVDRNTFNVNINCLDPSGTETHTNHPHSSMFDLKIDNGAWTTNLYNEIGLSAVRYGQKVTIGNIRVRPGYALDSVTGATSNGNGTYSLTVTAAATITIKTKIRQFPVTFDLAQGTTTGTTSFTQNFGTSVTAPTVTRTGYMFKQWIPVKHDDARWVEIMYQSPMAAWFANTAGAQSKNELDLYSRLGQVSYLRMNNKYDYLLSCDQWSGSMRWRQTNDINSTTPALTAASADGFEAVALSWDATTFKGLVNKSANGSTLAAYASGNGNWWYAIGAYVIYNGGIPIKAEGSNANGTAWQPVHLYLLSDDTFSNVNAAYASGYGAGASIPVRAETQKLKAQWTANTYTVHYNANGGSGTQMSDSAFVYDTPANLTANTYVAPSGYSFGGWADSVEHATAGVVYRANGAAHNNMTSTNGATVQLYAIWTRNITFHHGWNDESSSVLAQFWDSDRSSGTSITTPTASQCSVISGWSLVAWAISPTTASPVISTNATIVPTDSDFFALYGRNGEIRYKTSTDATQLYRSSMQSMNMSVRSGKYGTFSWEASQQIINSGSTTVYNSLTVTLADPNKTDYIDIESTNLNVVDPNPFTSRIGYVFTSWDLGNANSTYSWTPTLNESSIALATAQWSANTYTVAYAGMDGASYGSSHPTSATYDTAFTVNNPTKTGYTFSGWKITGMDTVTHTYGSTTTTATEISSTKETSFKNLRSTAGTVTFTAQWTAHTYTVVYNKNGGSGTNMANSVFTYDVAANLTANSYTAPSGYMFGGWANSVANATAGTVYRTNSAAHGNMTSTNGATVNLYAIWKRDITFHHGVNKAKNTVVIQYYDGANSKGASITTPTAATCTDISGWAELGWRDDTTAGAKEYDFNASIVPSVTTYYATYSSTITFYQGHKDASPYYNTSATATGYYNSSNVSTVTAPAIAAVSNWTARGWRDDTTAADREYAVTTAAAVTGFGTARAFYAVYSQVPVMSYAAGGGTGTTGNTNGTTRYMNAGNASLSGNAAWALASNAFTRPGYTFDGWDLGAAGASYSVAIAWNASPSKTATAKWKGVSYQVRFNANGGSGTMANQTGFVYGTAKALTANAFTAPSGYSFSGWATSVANATAGMVAYANQANMTTGTTTANGTVDLYAIWTRSITFYHGASKAKNTVVVQKWDGANSKGANITTPAATTCTDISGWTELGWRDDATAGAKEYDFNASIAPNATAYYAVYSRTLTMQYANGGGTGTAPANTTATQYYSTNPNITSPAITLAANTFTRTGYMFNKWDQGNASSSYTWSIAVGATDITRTATAQWTANTYTISYAGMEGASYGSSHPASATYDAAFTVNNPTKTGYTFTGWKITGMDSVTHTCGSSTTTATSLDSTKETSFKNLRSTAGTVTFTAQWTINSYTLTINPNGGSWGGTASNSTVTQNYNTTKDIAAPTRTGYTFVGWAETGAGRTSTNTNADPAMESGWGGNGKYYNSDSNNVLTVTREGVSGPAYAGATGIKLVRSNANAGSANPGLGGFVLSTSSAASKKFVHVFVAKIPTGYYLSIHNNSTGTGATRGWLTPNWGTGDWATYAYYTNCGASGTFSTFGHVALNGTAPVTWYVAYSAMIDITAGTGTTYAYDAGNGTLTALWAPNVYKVTLNNQSATSAGTAEYYYRYGTSTAVGTTNPAYFFSDAACANPLGSNSYTITTPTKTGYTFGGYYTGTNGGGTQYVNASGSCVNNLWSSNANNITLYAKWTANTYTVSYAGMDGASYGSSHPTSATYDTAFTVNNPTKTGYTFSGWKITGMDSVTHTYGSSTTTATEISSTTETSFKNLRSTSGTVTFTAQWTINKYNIDLNGTLDGTNASNVTNYATVDVYIPNTTQVATGVSDYCTQWNYGTTYKMVATAASGKHFVGGNTNTQTKEGTLAAGAADVRFALASYATVDRVKCVQNGTDSFYAYAYVTDHGGGINRVQFPTWTDANGQDDIQSSWGTNTAAAGTAGSWTIDGTAYNYRYEVKASDHNNEHGKYTIHVYAYDNYSGSKTGGSSFTFQYDVTYKDVFTNSSKATNGTAGTDYVLLGSTTEKKDYGTTVAGSDKGTTTTKGTYYANYFYNSCSSATVGTSGATVYRYFTAWSNINVLNPADAEKTDGSVATFTLAYGAPVSTNQTGQSNEQNVGLWRGETITLSAVTTKITGQHLTSVTTSSSANLPLTSSNGTYTATVKAAGSTIAVNTDWNTYTVEYYDGATKLGSSSHTYETGKALTTIATLNGSKSGFTFAGWATANQNCTVTYTDGQTVKNLTTTNNGTVKLYAVWQRTATFYSGAAKATTNTVTQYQNNGTYSIAAPAPAAISGWTALGWRDDTTAGAKEFGSASAATITSSATAFYATYSRTAKVTYNGNSNTSGSTADSSATQYYNSNGTIMTPEMTLTANGYARTGYTFDGWATTSTGSVRYGDRQSVTFTGYYALTGAATVTLYAVWAQDGVAVTTQNATFAYTGAPQVWKAPKAGDYIFEAWGAQGGTRGTGTGGNGGYTTGRVTLAKDQVIYIYVGGQGYQYDDITNAGGWNGGGYSGNNSGARSAGGGGATDFRLSTGAWNNSTSLASRVMVAAGGGGTSNATSTNAGAGGGLTGGAGTSSNSTYNNATYLPQGGSQTAGGFGYQNNTTRNGALGMGVQLNSGGWGGGGGSGYYGGGNGHGTTGAGGSSYVSGLSGCTTHASMSFTAASTTTGVRSGNGQAKITYVPVVTYNYHGGSGSPATANALTVTLPTPTRTGYTFSGWFTAETGGTKVGTGGASYSPSNDITLHAQWTANTYTISYAGMTGTVDATRPTTATYDTAFTVSNPKRAGYTFSGWNITGLDSVTHTYGSSTTTASSISSTTATSFKNLRSTAGTVTFTAQWTANKYTVTFDGNSGTISGTASFNQNYATTVTAPSATRMGYTFKGWVPVKADDTKWVELVYQEAANAWFTNATDAQAKNTLELWSMLGQNSKFLKGGKYEYLMTADDLTGYNQWRQTSDPTTATSIAGFESVSLSWDAAKFVGLCKNGTASQALLKWNQSGWWYAVASFAKYQGGIPIISANGNTTGVARAPVHFYVLSDSTLSNVDRSLSTGVTGGTTVPVRAENQAFKALWQNNTYTVHYNANGGSGTVADTTHTYDVASNLAANGFTAPTTNGGSWTFAGWATSADRAKAGTVDRNGGAAHGNLVNTAGGSITLYAVWKRTVTFKSGVNKGGTSTDVTEWYDGPNTKGAGLTTPASDKATSIGASGDRAAWTATGWRDDTTADTAEAGFSASFLPQATTCYAIYTGNVNFISGSNKAKTTGVASVYNAANTWKAITTASQNDSQDISGWTERGWRTDSTEADRTIQYAASLTPTQFYYYGAYSRTITFKSGINKATSTDVTQYYNSAQAATTYSNITAPTPATIGASGDRTAWTTLGWRDDTTAGDKEVASAASFSPSTVTTYYAVYSGKIQFKSGYNKAKTTEVVGYYNSNNAWSQIASATAADCQDVTTWTELGWRSDTTATAKSVDFNAAFTPTAFVYYATYSRTGTVGYAGNGNTGGSTASTTSAAQYMNSGNTSLAAASLSVTLAQNGFTKTGYTFSKWDLGNAGTSYSWTPAYNAATGKTATATWTANTYSISYAGMAAANFADNAAASHGSSHPTSATYDTEFTVNNPTKTGYTFTGWKIENMDSVTHTYGATTTTATSIASTKEIKFKNLRSTSGTVTFTAQWTRNQYTVTCKDVFTNKNKDLTAGNYIELGSSTKTLDYASTVSGATWGTNTARSAYRSNYYYDSSSTETTVPANNNLIVYRYFTAWEDINVFNPAGVQQSTAIATMTIQYGAKLNRTDTGVGNESYPNPQGLWRDETIVISNIQMSQPYYVFDRISSYDSAMIMTANNNTYTFTSKTSGGRADIWTRYSNYSIRFNANGGSGTMSNLSMTYNTAKNLTTNGFTAPTTNGGSWAFAGWATTAARAKAGNIDYTNGQEVTNLAATDGATVDLYAVWKRAVTFKSGVNKGGTSTDVTEYYDGPNARGAGVTTPASDKATAIGASGDRAAWTATGWRDDTTADTAEAGFSASFLPQATTCYAIYTGNVNFISGSNKTKTTGVASVYNAANTWKAITTATQSDSQDITDWGERGWRADTTEADRTIQYGASLTPAQFYYYGAYSRAITFKSGVAEATSAPATQYYNSAQAATTYSNITAPTPAAIGASGDRTAWITLGWRDDITAGDKEVAAAASFSPSTVTTYYAVYSGKVQFKSGYNKATTTEGATSYYNSKNIWSQITSATATDCQDVTTWAELGWRADTTATTKSIDFNATFTPTAFAYYATYSRSGTMAYAGGTGATGSTASTGTNTQYMSSGNTNLNAASLTTTLAQNGFSKTGYTFNKWNLGNAGASYTWTPAYNAATSKTATAQWTNNSYKVHYDANGGTGSQMADSTFTYDVPANLTANAYAAPTDLGGGWSFGGWADSVEHANAGTVYRENQAPHANMTATDGATVNLYAIWKRTITFKSGPKQATTKTTVQYRNATPANSAVAVPSGNTALDGWTLSGWREDTTAAAATHAATGSIKPTATTLYAVYTRTVTFWSGVNKATHPTATQYRNTGTTATETWSVAIPSAPAAIANGWTATGWKVDTIAGAASYPTTGAITAEAGPEFYATYTRSGSITYSGNNNTGGSTATTTGGTQTYNSGNNITSVTVPLAANGFVRTGYTFTRWDIGDAGTDHTWTPAVTAVATKVATAQWSANTYTVTYDKNQEAGSSEVVGTTPDSSHTYDTARNLTTNGYSRIGYDFTGWKYGVSDMDTWFNVRGSAQCAVVQSGRETTITYNTTSGWETLASGGIPVTPGDTYTLSFDYQTMQAMAYYSTNAWYGISVHTSFQSQNSNVTDVIANTSFKMETMTDYEHLTLQFTVPANTHTVYFALNGGRLNDGQSNKIVKIRNLEVAEMTYEDTQSVVNLSTLTDNRVRLVAQWSPHSHNIAYDLNKPAGGSTTPALGERHPTTATYDEPVDIDNPTLEGYVFTGWTITGLDGTRHLVGGQETTDTTLDGIKATTFANLTAVGGSTVTFKANWVADTYTVHYDANAWAGDITGTMPDETATWDADYTIARPGYANELANFIGWDTKADGTGTRYYEGNKVRNLAAVQTTFTLYAQWEAKQLRVSVPVAIHYVADTEGNVAGPTDDVVRIRNMGETHVELDRMSVQVANGIQLVREGNTLSAHQASMGLKIDDGERIDLSTVDGDAKKRYAWLTPDQDVFLNELNGRIGDHDLSADTNVGHIEWHFKAARASER